MEKLQCDPLVNGAIRGKILYTDFPVENIWRSFGLGAIVLHGPDPEYMMMESSWA